MESHIATIGHVYLSYLHGITRSQHLHFVRTVDDQPQPRPVYLRIVAYIAQFLHLTRIALCIDVTQVVSRLAREVQIVQRTFVRTHITLVQHIHAEHIRWFGLDADVLLFHIDDIVVRSTTDDAQQQGYIYNKVSLHIFTSNVIP